MKKLTGTGIVLSAILLSCALVYSSQTGRYQITSGGALPGVYRVDTQTGEVSVCSPLRENSCESLESVRKNFTQMGTDLQGSLTNAPEDLMQSLQDLIAGAWQKPDQNTKPTESPKE